MVYKQSNAIDTVYMYNHALNMHAKSLDVDFEIIWYLLDWRRNANLDWLKNSGDFASTEKLDYDVICITAAFRIQIIQNKKKELKCTLTFLKYNEN